MIKALLTLLFLLNTVLLNAQAPTNYSGQWEFDKTESSPDVLEATYDGTVILQIVQDDSQIKFSEVWKKPGEADFETSQDIYKLDGKEQVRTSDIGTSKNSTKWSDDKKILTITNLDTQSLHEVMADFLVVETYKLSEDGLTLTIERYSNNPVKGENTDRKVYHRQ